MSRQCGNCTACCLTHAVEELKKPKCRWCKECNQGEGCRIYSTRPKSCADFRCMWLMGHGEEFHRPDILGVVMDCWQKPPLGLTLMIWEAIEGSLTSTEVWETTHTAFDKGMAVCHMYLSGRSIVFAKALPKKLKQRLIREGAEIGTLPIINL